MAGVIRLPVSIVSLIAMAAKAVASGTTAGTVAPHHKGLIAGAAMSLSLIGDAMMAALHLKEKGH